MALIASWASGRCSSNALPLTLSWGLLLPLLLLLLG
jgi:hypothetical protein